MGESYFYKTYALNLQSDIRLTEIPELVSTPKEVEVQIKRGAVNPKGLAQGEQVGPFLWTTSTQLQLHIPGVSRFLIENGESIIYDPEPGIDEDSIRVFMLGSCLGALLFQRGFFVLHGNAIQIGNECIICVGHSGAGKSTLAAAFMKRGYNLLADDVVPIGDDCKAIAGFPRIKLWKDAANKLGIETDGLTRIRPDIEKFNVPISDNFVTTPLPVKHIFVLRSDHEMGFSSEEIEGLNKFRVLSINTYRKKYLDSMALKSTHLKLCGKVAAKAALTMVMRPKTGFAIDQLVDHILAECGQND